MGDNFLIAVEGFPCAGKTSLCQRLSENFGISVVPELADFLHKEEFFPGDGENIDEVLSIAEWFYNKEKKRHLLAKKYLCTSKKYLCTSNVIMDRTYYTMLTYNYAYQAYKRIFDYRILNKRIFNFINLGNYLKPNIIFYLEISPDILRERRNNRIYIPPASLPDFWLEDSFLIPLKKAYDFYLKKYNLPVIAINATIPIDEVHGYAIDKIREFCFSSFNQLSQSNNVL